MGSTAFGERGGCADPGVSTVPHSGGGRVRPLCVRLCQSTLASPIRIRLSRAAIGFERCHRRGRARSSTRAIDPDGLCAPRSDVDRRGGERRTPSRTARESVSPGTRLPACEPPRSRRRVGVGKRLVRCYTRGDPRQRRVLRERAGRDVCESGAGRPDEEHGEGPRHHGDRPSSGRPGGVLVERFSAAVRPRRSGLSRQIAVRTRYPPVSVTVTVTGGGTTVTVDSTVVVTT